jgi:hypothetical protein
LDGKADANHFARQRDRISIRACAAFTALFANYDFVASAGNRRHFIA